MAHQNGFAGFTHWGIRMNGAEFRRRREAIGYKTRPQAGRSIGCAAVTVKHWEKDINPIPRFAINWLVRQENDYEKSRNRR